MLVTAIFDAMKSHFIIIANKRRRVNRAAGAVEATAALAALLGVAFFVTTQDNTSMIQAQKDARQAMAQLWLENEVALCRVSQPPWTTGTNNNRLSLYTLAGTTQVLDNLVGVGNLGVGPTTAVNTYSSRFGSGGAGGTDPASVERVLVQEDDDGLDGLIFHSYRTTLRVPFALPGGQRATNEYIREHRRIFQSRD